MTTLTQTSNAERTIPTRRVDLDETFADVPKYFAADGDLLLSHFAAALSSVFPDGEDYFVRSVRRFRDQIEDPALKKQVAGFIGQESVHGREHRAFNARLAALGYPTKYVERITKRVLELRERIMSDKSNLAATAALEHYTATLAEALLSNDEIQRQFGHDGVKNLFLWHALEESEHKAVAFDVYRAAGGTERMRRVTMNVMTVGFIAGMTLQMAASLALDRRTYRVWELPRSWRRFTSSPLLTKAVWRKLRDYNRPGFHPDDYDTTELEERWRNQLFGETGDLTGRLPTAAA
jgi:uncharacterized protein